MLTLKKINNFVRSVKFVRYIETIYKTIDSEVNKLSNLPHPYVCKISKIQIESIFESIYKSEDVNFKVHKIIATNGMCNSFNFNSIKPFYGVEPTDDSNNSIQTLNKTKNTFFLLRDLHSNTFCQLNELLNNNDVPHAEIEQYDKIVDLLSKLHYYQFCSVVTVSHFGEIARFAVDTFNKHRMTVQTILNFNNMNEIYCSMSNSYISSNEKFNDKLKNFNEHSNGLFGSINVSQLSDHYKLEKIKSSEYLDNLRYKLKKYANEVMICQTNGTPCDKEIIILRNYDQQLKQIISIKSLESKLVRLFNKLNVTHNFEAETTDTFHKLTRLLSDNLIISTIEINKFNKYTISNIGPHEHQTMHKLYNNYHYCYFRMTVLFIEIRKTVGLTEHKQIFHKMDNILNKINKLNEKFLNKKMLLKPFCDNLDEIVKKIN